MIAPQITISLTTAGGGISLAVLSLSQALEKAGCTASLHGMADGGRTLDGIRDSNLVPHPVSSRLPIPRSQSLRQALEQMPANLFHLHGLWTYPSAAIPGVARSRSLPWVVSPHGMLDSWALAHSRWKKKIAAWGFEDRNLKGAACLHALCQSEADSIRAYGLTNRVEIIPNGVDLPAMAENRGSRPNERKKLLFLGRLHEKKGLIPALEAWPAVKDSGWQFVIAGWDQGGHIDLLKKLCQEKGLTFEDRPAAEIPASSSSADVIFAGSAFGEIKEALLWSCDAFILPSFSEGLPIAILEAWAHALPVLMTSHCNLPEGFATGAAVECSTDSKALAGELRAFLGQADAAFAEMSRKGRELVATRFIWSSVASRMLELYAEVTA